MTLRKPVSNVTNRSKVVSIRRQGRLQVKTGEENIEKLKALSKLSPVFDVTSNGTKVDVIIERK